MCLCVCVFDILYITHSESIFASVLINGAFGEVHEKERQGDHVRGRNDKLLGAGRVFGVVEDSADEGVTVVFGCHDEIDFAVIA